MEKPTSRFGVDEALWRVLEKSHEFCRATVLVEFFFDTPGGDLSTSGGCVSLTEPWGRLETDSAKEPVWRLEPDRFRSLLPTTDSTTSLFKDPTTTPAGVVYGAEEVLACLKDFPVLPHVHHPGGTPMDKLLVSHTCLTARWDFYAKTPPENTPVVRGELELCIPPCYRVELTRFHRGLRDGESPWTYRAVGSAWAHATPILDANFSLPEPLDRAVGGGATELIWNALGLPAEEPNDDSRRLSPIHYEFPVDENDAAFFCD